MAWINTSARLAPPGSTTVPGERNRIPVVSSAANRDGAAQQRNGQMRNFKDIPDPPVKMPEVGIVLLNESLKIVACDRGAAVLLSSVEPTDGVDVSSLRVPREILEELRERKSTGKTSGELQFRVGANDYLCRAYPLETRSGCLTELSFLALHLQRVAGAQEAIQAAIASYHLTEREEQTLKGILMGLSSKEVADQMRISPNTVKAFTRLIMIKLGVATRWGIIAKTLGNREIPEDSPRSAGDSEST